MADSKISALAALGATPASGDLFVVVDVSDTTMAASGTSKKVTFSEVTSTFLTSSTGLLATGATAGATSQAQTFTNGIITAGSVGINTTPTRALDLVGNFRLQSTLTTATAKDARIQQACYDTAEEPLTLLLASARLAENVLYYGGGSSIENAATQIEFFTAAAVNTLQGTSRMVINSSGNVGIGVTPTHRLSEQFSSTLTYSDTTLQGDGVLVSNVNSSTSNGTFAQLRMQASANSGATSGIGMINLIQTTNGSRAAEFSFQLRTAGNTIFEIMRMLSTGRVGIMTSAPTAFLHVPASTTAAASFCAPQGTAPTTPVVGDIWNDGALSFYNADSTTNAVVNHLRLRRNSTGTAAAGFGLGIIAELESSTTDAQSAGRLTWAWSTATHASRAAIGKLTAYYTSTEREALTWTATSSGVRVGVGTASPLSGLHIDMATVGDGGANDGDDSVVYIRQQTAWSGSQPWALFVDGSSRLGGLRINAADGPRSLYLATGELGIATGDTSPITLTQSASTERMRIHTNGYLGIGTAAPVGLLHGHDGSGGFLFVNRTGVDSTLVTVIPDGTGDVTERLHMFGWVSNSSGGFVSQVNEVYLDVSSSTTKTDGSNTLTIAVTAAGAFTLQTTLGTATWKVLLWVFWR